MIAGGAAALVYAHDSAPGIVLVGMGVSIGLPVVGFSFLVKDTFTVTQSP